MWHSRPPPLHGKCHLKFPFWLLAPLPNLFSRKYYPYPVIAFPLQRPMIFKGLVFHQIQRQLCHKKRSSLQASTQSMSSQIFTIETIVNSSVEGWHILKNHHSLSVFFLILALQTSVSIWAQSSDPHLSKLLTRRAKVMPAQWSSCLTITLFEKRSAD